MALLGVPREVSDLIEAKVGEDIKGRAVLIQIWQQLSPEKFVRFCESTPHGDEFWEAFANFRAAMVRETHQNRLFGKTKEEYNPEQAFKDFALHVLEKTTE